MEEVWKDIKGYEGYYQVSNKGRVRSIDRIVDKGGKRTNLKGRVLKQALCGRYRDYWFVGLSKNNIVKRRYVHDLVARHFSEICGEWFEGAQVNHKDENKSNNCAENLEWCTPLYNLTYNDRHIKVGLKERGKKSPYRKKVKVFKKGEWIATFFTPKDAGDFIGVSDISVRNSIYGRTHIVKGVYSFEYLDGSGRLTDEEINDRKNRANYLRRQKYAKHTV